MNLIIVESPTKARTLSRFLSDDFIVEATVGHIKDLPKSKLAIDVEKDFKPNYELVKDKSKNIRIIEESAVKAKQIYLATDPDREGEAIAKHVKEILKKDGAKKADGNISRIVFHEITQTAVEEAIKNPRRIDKNLVDAQIARRVLDRLVGYKLSPLLWKKVRRGLSAGRVQTVVVRLIVEKEREIKAFKPKEYWEIYCDLERIKEKESFSVKLVKVNDAREEIGNSKRAKEVVFDLKKSTYKVKDVKKREVVKNPYPPFTTSTMTQAAARAYFWSTKKTMNIAQKLYEEGLITYHRTDSTNISKTAISDVRSYIKNKYGNEYLPEKERFYKTKAKVAQEAHEAIRPTNVKKLSDKMKLTRSMSLDHKKLYDLIWKKFVSCQMSASIYDETKIEVEAKISSSQKESYLLRVAGQIQKFDGWRLFFNSKKGKDNLLPDVKVDELLNLLKVNSEQKFTEPPPRYGEASLVRTLEKLGIGRPSTYAPIISTIQQRNYVEKKEGKFYPTLVGISVNDFLIKHFVDLFDYSFTAEMENDLDSIAEGKKEWAKMMKDFYKPFDKKLSSVTKKSKRVKIETEKLGKKCPDCKGGELVIRIGRFGKFISCSNFPECKHTEKYIEKIGKKCPDCKKGDIIIKVTRSRRKFYGCSRYPDCEWASWRKPSVKEKK